MTSKEWSKEKLNTIEVIENLFPMLDTSHIKFDPKMKMHDREYWIIRTTSHDGTHAFSLELMNRALLPLVQKTSYFGPSAPCEEKAKNLINIKYTVGHIYRSICYGMVDVPVGNIPGQGERVRIPVRCEYVFRRKVNKRKLNIDKDDVERLINLKYTHEQIGETLKVGATKNRCRINITKFLSGFDIIEVTPRVVKLVPKKGKS